MMGKPATSSFEMTSKSLSEEESIVRRVMKVVNFFDWVLNGTMRPNESRFLKVQKSKINIVSII